MLLMSSLAAARWIRKGISTASVVAASAAVQDHEAATSLVAVSMSSGDTTVRASLEGGCERRTNWDRTFPICSRLCSIAAG
jgi:hypothetical protein